ncbi:sodium:proton exchanger [Pandoraea terrae]|uniref:Sodium:proton exchanger n=1 Tax=Pandoraea terrae TaxID=1537710 RepID=A0A5E4W210_9BURK|nr:cation:proton antiporter [Pandoraea terrae]VVE17594.1 sodium:proton exchanger [Pandoraea terrae]
MTSELSLFPGWPPAPDPVFFAGLALVVAGLFGELCYRKLRLPRIIGYAAVGLVGGTFGLSSMLDAQTSAAVRLLIDLALGLLLFELGSRLNLKWMRANLWLIVSSAGEALLTFVAVFATLSFFSIEPLTAVLIAAISMATSPAVVIQLKNELRAEGQVTERLLALAALNSIYSVVAVKLIYGWMHQAYHTSLSVTLLHPLYLLVGSCVLAWLLAKACNFLFRSFGGQDHHAFVMLLGLIMLTVALVHMLRLPNSLTLLLAGVIFKNLEERPQLWPAYFGTAGWLLAVVLFVLTSLAFQWHYVLVGGVAAFAIILVRGVAKVAGVLAFARPAGISYKQALALGLSLCPMASLAFVLMADTYDIYPQFDEALRAVVMCAIALLQLVGPLVVYWALALAGERKD